LRNKHDRFKINFVARKLESASNISNLFQAGDHMAAKLPQVAVLAPLKARSNKAQALFSWLK
jgi:hypothetical protein